MEVKGISVLFSRLGSITACAGLIAVSCCVSHLPAGAQAMSHTDTPLHMPQGAFLRLPSPNVALLVQQVKSDPSVAVRYARLFHLPVKMVPLAFAQMSQKKLASDHIMQVHYVKGAGNGKEELVYKMRRVRAGTPVYCLPDGTPILVRVCGNPIRTRVSPEFYTTAPVPNFNAREMLLPKPHLDSSTAFTNDTSRAVPMPDVPLPAITMVPATDVLPVALLPAAPGLPLPALRAASLPPVYTWAHTPGGLYGLGGLPVLGLLTLLDVGRHGSVTPFTPINTQPVVPPTPTPTTSVTPTAPVILFLPAASVPEPGVLAIGFIGLLGAVYMRLCRRR